MFAAANNLGGPVVGFTCPFVHNHIPVEIREYLFTSLLMGCTTCALLVNMVVLWWNGSKKNVQRRF